MFMSVEVKLDGTAFLPGRAEAEVRHVIKEQLTGASLAYIREVKPATPVGVFGNLQKEWQFAYDDATLTSKIFPGTVEYAQAVELGRKAAPVPIEPLRLWVKRKLGITDPKEIRSVAFLIGRKKKQQATEGQFFATKAWQKSLPVINSAFMEPMGAKIVERLST